MSLPGFPPPSHAPRTISFKALVEDADSTREVPVTYAFGGQAPTTVPVVGSVLTAAEPQAARRWFVEMQPYYWMP